MSLIIKQVTAPTDAELDEYAKLSAEAFDYNYFASCLAKDKSLQEPFLRCHMTSALVEHGGEVYIAELPDVGPVGVAVWFKPGHIFLGTEAQRSTGYNQVIEKLPKELQDFWPGFLKQYEGLAEKFLGPGVKLGGYHLQLVAVRREHQRKGIGAALMRAGESKARVARVPCCLETGGDDNIAFYNSIGYNVAGTGPLNAPPPSTKTFNLSVLVKHTENAEN